MGFQVRNLRISRHFFSGSMLNFRDVPTPTPGPQLPSNHPRTSWRAAKLPLPTSKAFASKVIIAPPKRPTWTARDSPFMAYDGLLKDTRLGTLKVTPPAKINVEPEKWRFGRWVSFSIGWFSGSSRSFSVKVPIYGIIEWHAISHDGLSRTRFAPKSILIELHGAPMNGLTNFTQSAGPLLVINGAITPINGRIIFITGPGAHLVRYSMEESWTLFSDVLGMVFPLKRPYPVSTSMFGVNISHRIHGIFLYLYLSNWLGTIGSVQLPTFTIQKST